MAVDLAAVSEELLKAQDAHTKLVLAQLATEMKKKTALEAAKNAAAAAPTDGKAPSEAACERIAKQDMQYLKLCNEEIEAIGAAMFATNKVSYLQRKFEMFMAVAQKEK